MKEFDDYFDTKLKLYEGANPAPGFGGTPSNPAQTQTSTQTPTTQQATTPTTQTQNPPANQNNPQSKLPKQVMDFAEVLKTTGNDPNKIGELITGINNNPELSKTFNSFIGQYAKAYPDVLKQQTQFQKVMGVANKAFGGLGGV